MAITFRGVGSATPQTNGVSGTGVATVATPTMPASTANGDRIFVFVMASGLADTTPTDWNVLAKDVQCGSGAIANASGLRYQSVYWRDRDASWSAIPAFSLLSRLNPGMVVPTIGIRPTAGSVFATPTVSTVNGAFNAATTSYTDTTAASFDTHTGGFLFAGTVLNSQVFTVSAGAITQTGATIGTVTSRATNSLNTGDDSTGTLWTAPVTTGASATVTHTLTLSGASQGETLIVEQTEFVGALARRALTRLQAVNRASTY